MPDIRNMIQIDAPLVRVYPFVSSGAGFSIWWAEDMSVRPEGVVDLGFFNRATIYSLRLIKTAPPGGAEWLCESGKEWKGTKIIFQLSEVNGNTLLRFSHANWEAETDYFLSCSSTWGALMFRIKSIAEGGAMRPLFSKAGWSL